MIEDVRYFDRENASGWQNGKGTPVRFATVEDLVILKLVAGRPRHLEDIRGILARRQSLDEAYLKRRLPTSRHVVRHDLLRELESIKKSL